MNRIMYKGCEIHAVPFRSSVSNRWNAHVYISVNHGKTVDTLQFTDGCGVEREDRAVQHCFDFGRQIIDGKMAVPV